MVIQELERAREASLYQCGIEGVSVEKEVAFKI